MPLISAPGASCSRMHRAFRLLISRSSPSSCSLIKRFGLHSLEHRSINSPHHRTQSAAQLPIAHSTTKILASKTKNAPLAIIPLGVIIRSLLITSISSSPTLQGWLIEVLLILARSRNAILNPDKNPVLHLLLKKTFYAQFCAGETSVEVRSTIASLKDIGFNGVILTHAKEATLSGNEASITAGDDLGKETTHDIASDIEPWFKSTLETIKLAEPGDYVALKLTGSGRLALYHLSRNEKPSPYLYKSIHKICTFAQRRGVRLIFDAEQDAIQKGIDSWTMMFARGYNTPNTATVYGTYQAYKKVTPTTISRHLAEAQERGFALGMKLVRGAYLGSDPRQCFWATKSETDACYNTIAYAVLTQQWGPMIKGKGKFPDAHLVLATHNSESVDQARVICDAGSAKSGIIVAQLQGMADEVGCELIAAKDGNKSITLPVYKYLVWGTTAECMKYLLRRAHENQDAYQRTQRSRDAMFLELTRRLKTAVGF